MADANASAILVDSPARSERLNVADRLAESAARDPQGIAVACPGRGSQKYATITFAELDADASRIARGLLDWGVRPGMRIALLVRPGIEFVTLVFALLRVGVVIVLVDPGLGRRNLVCCLAEAEPDGFIAIPVAQAARLCVRSKFPRAKWNVTVGRRWFWGGMTLKALRRRGDGMRSMSAKADLRPATLADDPAAIIFTSGSTGPPKGVLYTQRMFDTQVSEIRSVYGIQPGGVDLSCFPLFALFNAAMGVTTVLPEMDFSRPASADPRKLLAAANDWRVTQAFASPAVWRSFTDHLGQGKVEEQVSSLKQIFSCGAPVPADLLGRLLHCAGSYAKVHTPYGATECLPVATIEAAEVLAETVDRSADGAGICVGRKFDTIEWRVIRITDEPIARIEDAEELPTGEIGELVVRGPQASPCYVIRPEFNSMAKIAGSSERAGQSSAPHGGEDAPARADIDSAPWHRMGDVGYLDNAGRFWYCGRKSQRVVTSDGPMYTECVEALFNAHRDIRRSALVGVGPRGWQCPVMICEPTPAVAWCGGRRMSKHAALPLVRELRELASKHRLTRGIEHFLIRDSLPVDIRHNAKINREQLAAWAATKLPELA